MTSGGNILKASLLLSATILLYFQCRTFEFLNFDDNVYVTANPWVKSGLSWSSFWWALDPQNGYDWHPLSWLSLMIDVSLFGVSAKAMHLTNVVLHGLNVALVFMVFQSATGKSNRSVFLALIWGIYPLRVESVAWISERKDVLSMFFGLISIWLYILFAKHNWKTLQLSVLAFSLSLLSKPTFLTMPALLVILDFWPLYRYQGTWAYWKQSVYEKHRYVLLSAGVSVIVFISQASNGGLKQLPFLESLSLVFPGYLAYIGKLFWPLNLSCFYPLILYPSGLAAGSFVALLLLTLLSFALHRNYPAVVAGWLWFLISLLPMIGFVPIGGQLLADRWTYLAHLGLLIALIWPLSDALLDRARSDRIRKSTIVFASSVIFLLTVCTTQELGYWKNSKTLFERALEKTSLNFLAHTNLASALLEEGNLALASFHSEEAVRINPTYVEGINNLGTVRAYQGRFEEARIYFKKALALRPGFVTAENNLRQVEADLGAPSNRLDVTR